MVVINEAYYKERIVTIFLASVMTIIIMTQLIGVGIALQWFPFNYLSRRRVQSTAAGHGNGNNVANGAVTHRSTRGAGAAADQHNDNTPNTPTVSPMKLRILFWITFGNCWAILLSADPQSAFGIISPVLAQWCLRNMIACYAHIYRIWTYGTLSLLYRDASRPIPRWINPLLVAMCTIVHVGGQLFPLLAWIYNKQLYLGIMASAWAALAGLLPIVSITSGCLITRTMRHIQRAVHASSPTHVVVTHNISPVQQPRDRYQLRTVASSRALVSPDPNKPLNTFLPSPLGNGPATAVMANVPTSMSSSDDAYIAAGLLSHDGGNTSASSPPPTNRRTQSSHRVPASTTTAASTAAGGPLASPSPLTSSKSYRHLPTSTAEVAKIRDARVFNTAINRLWGIIIGGWIGFTMSMISSINQAESFMANADDAPTGANPQSYSVSIPFITVCIGYAVSIWYDII
jgi:hypothetical protein